MNTRFVKATEGQKLKAKKVHSAALSELRSKKVVTQALLYVCVPRKERKRPNVEYGMDNWTEAENSEPAKD